MNNEVNSKEYVEDETVFLDNKWDAQQISYIGKNTKRVNGKRVCRASYSGSAFPVDLLHSPISNNPIIRLEFTNASLEVFTDEVGTHTLVTFKVLFWQWLRQSSLKVYIEGMFGRAFGKSIYINVKYFRPKGFHEMQIAFGEHFSTNSHIESKK